METRQILRRDELTTKQRLWGALVGQRGPDNVDSHSLRIETVSARAFGSARRIQLLRGVKRAVLIRQ